MGATALPAFSPGPYLQGVIRLCKVDMVGWEFLPRHRKVRLHHLVEQDFKTLPKRRIFQ